VCRKKRVGMLVTVGAHRVYYDLLGDAAAPVVAFMHSLAADGGMWAEQVPALLSGGFRVLRVDMRGHGGTQAVDGPYTLTALADDVTALLAMLEIERVHFVGLSIGAMIGQSLALRNPSAFDSFLLCDTLPSAPASARASWSGPLAMVRRANSLSPMRGGMLKAWLSDTFKATHPARWKSIADTLLATSPAGFEGCVAAMSDFDFTDDLPSVRVPALVVCGDADPMTPPAENRRLAQLMPGARYEEIPDARHFSNVEQAEVFNRILLDWLNVRR